MGGERGSKNINKPKKRLRYFAHLFSLHTSTKWLYMRTDVRISDVHCVLESCKLKLLGKLVIQNMLPMY